MSKWTSAVLALLLGLQIYLLISCDTLKYKDDIGLVVSAQANSPEVPVYIGEHFCKDMEGISGLCSKRIRSDETINLKLDPLPYSYQLNFKCSSSTGIDFKINVDLNTPWTFAITPDRFSSVISFSCIGSIQPLDREKVSGNFEIKFVIYDTKYTRREEMNVYKYKNKWYLVLGQYARNSVIWDKVNGKTTKKTYTKETIVEVNDYKGVKAYSGSYNMRFNHYGL